MSFKKGSSDSTSNSTTNYNNNGTYTPNNLAALQQGWNAAGAMFANNNGQDLLNAGTSALFSGAAGAAGVNSTAAGTAGNFANGDYVNNPANADLAATARGDYVGANNPQFQNVVDQFSHAAQAGTDGSYAASGRYGSGANANAFNTAVANEAGQLGYQNYTQQQQNQLTAAGLLGNNVTAGRQQQLAGASLAPALTTAMLEPGAALTAAGYSPLQNYIAAVTAGNAGGTQTNKGTQTTNTTEQGDATQFGFAPKFSLGPFSFGG